MNVPTRPRGNCLWARAAYRERSRGHVELPLFPVLTEPSASRCLTGSSENRWANGDIRLVRGWLERERADALLASIRATTRWIQEKRRMYDRIVTVPREQAWFGDDRERPFPPELSVLRGELEAFTGAHFAFVLLNRYRDGNDSVAWHSDRDAIGLTRPVIASLSLGATRAFDLRPKTAPAQVTSIDLDHGDLLVMRGASQTDYEHRVAKDAKIAGERINLTFRQQPE